MTLRSIVRYHATKFRIDPDDLEQEIQIKLLQKGGMYRDTGSSYFTWVNRLVHNYCIDVTRKLHNRQSFVSQELYQGGTQPSSSFEQRQYIASIFFKVRRHWPRNARLNTRVLWLWMTGWKIREIADELNVPENTIKGIIFRIREIL